ASLGGVLTFSFGDSVRVDYRNGKSKYAPPITVIGSQMARSSCAHYCGSHFDFGIFLKPVALWQLFRIPPAVLADGDGDSRDVIGNRIHTLWLQLAESKLSNSAYKWPKRICCPSQSMRDLRPLS